MDCPLSIVGADGVMSPATNAGFTATDALGLDKTVPLDESVTLILK